MTKIFLTQDFSTASSTPPQGWTIDVIEGDAAVDQWRFDNPGDRTLPTFLTDPVAIFDSDNISNNNQKENVALVSPVFDASGSSQVYLKFDQQYLGLVDPDFGSEGIIEVFDGTQWQAVANQLTDVEAPTTLDISQYANANTQVRFRWTGNWSYQWVVDNVQVVDTLTPGLRLVGNPQISEDNVPDTRNFKFVLEKPPTADVTLNFTVEGNQLQPIQSLIFTPENWNVPQSSTVNAIADGIAEGDNQKTTIEITATSTDPGYNGLTQTATATITDHTIPGFPSYRTVEKTFADLGAIAQQNPGIASWVDIGDTYDKVTPGGAEGYDIYALELGNKSKDIGGKKPVLFVQGAIHAREYATAELISRFAEKLTAGYGYDADSTWLLDYFDIRVVPIVNPDGRKFAEQGYLWRKNTNPTVPESTEPAEFPNYGVDLNRNYASKWGEVEGGSSDDPSNSTYRGSAPFSEPESQSLRDYLLKTFPDQKADGDFEPAAADAAGVYLDVHSLGNLVLYPFGWTSDPAPNSTALRNLGLKFGYYTGLDGEAYDVQQAIGLYPTDGTTDDWVYQTFGAASYTIELGTQFFQPVDDFENTIVPEFTPALFYAAKSAYRPYQTSAGPDSVDVSLNQGQAVAGTNAKIVLTAIADATRYDDGNLSSEGITEGLELPTPATIKSSRYSINAPSWIAGTALYELTPADGVFDSPTETLTATIDTTNLAPGRHTIFVESQDVNGQYGVPSAIFLDILTAPENAFTLTGTEVHDVLTTQEKPSVLYGLGREDSLLGNSAADILIAGDGEDIVKGGKGKDLIYGGSGNDYLMGEAGNDKIYSEAGKDYLNGGTGDDVLWGGKGQDMLEGGQGKDTFVLAYGDGTDIIQDFAIGIDKIGLAGTLNFSQLAIAESGQSAFINFGTERLAELRGIKANQLTADSFLSLSAVG